MNIKERLRHLASRSMMVRGSGRTTQNTKAAMETHGIVIAATFLHAKNIEHHFPGVVAKSMELNMDKYDSPLYFDHYAIESMFLRAANKIDELEKDIEVLKEGYDLMKQLSSAAASITEDAASKIEDLQKQKQELKNILADQIGSSKADLILTDKGYL